MVQTQLNLLNSKQNWVDCMREWLILVSSCAFGYYLIFAIGEIRKAQSVVDFDQIVLAIELLKVSTSLQMLHTYQVLIFLIVSFLVTDIAGLFLCYTLSSLIRSFICGSFLGKVIALQGKEKCATQTTYLYITVLTIYLAFCAISGFLDLSFLGVEWGATCV